MELIFSWIEKFRNYKEVNLNFSNRFKINYNLLNRSITLSQNNSYISIYPDYITNINAVVGKNGVGKTNLLDALGLRHNDRKKHNSEIEIKYRKRDRDRFGFRIPNDIEAEIKNSIYFFIYYMGKDINGQNLFCLEGNDIESFLNIIKKETGISNEYWRGKYWFSFLCNYSEGKFLHINDLNVKLGEYRIDSKERDVRYFGDNRSEKDKLAIISLRQTLNKKYYDFSSTKSEDDHNISVPRRVAEFQSKFLSMKIEMLYEQLTRTKKFMFKDDKYILKIMYNKFYLTDDSKLLMNYSYKDLEEKEKKICELLEAYIQYIFHSISNDNRYEHIEKKINNLKVKKKSLKEYIEYYLKVLNAILDSHFEEKTEEKQQYQERIVNCYKELAKKITKNKLLKFNKNYIEIDITIKSNIQEILELISITVDEQIKSEINGEPSVFGEFFNYSIENLSDGEVAYLGFYASLYEQISLLTPSKERYIILLDEPEERMHPEMTRNFLNELLLFLGTLHHGRKKFQIIISTHSPFILSDISSTNITYLEKDSMGYCKSIQRGLNTFGSNIHTLLKDGFFMSSTMGEFATSRIKSVVSLLSEDKDITSEQKNECLYIIKSIGEPLVRNRLMKLFDEKFHLDYTDLFNENTRIKIKLKKYEEPRGINESIEILKKQIENLQSHVNELEDKIYDKD